jgi:hypothetical protein
LERLQVDGRPGAGWHRRVAAKSGTLFVRSNPAGSSRLLIWRRQLPAFAACIGKWRLGDRPEFLPCRQGFDRSFGLPYFKDMQKTSAATGKKVVPLLRDDRVVELLTDEQQLGIAERCTCRSSLASDSGERAATAD